MLLFLWWVQKELSQISDENIWKAKQKSARSSKYTKILVNVLYLFLPEELHLGFYKQRSLLASAGAMLRWWMVCKEAADGGGILPGRGQSLNQESSRGGGHGQMVAAWTNERTNLGRSSTAASNHFKHVSNTIQIWLFLWPVHTVFIQTD